MRTRSSGVSGKVAVVTGAAGVLGRAISAALLAAGLRVALVDLNSDRVEQARADLGSAERTLAVPLDVSDVEAVEKAMQALAAKWGAPSVLINNAGILSNNKSAATSAAEFENVLRVNTTGAFLMAKCVWQERGGHRSFVLKGTFRRL